MMLAKVLISAFFIINFIAVSVFIINNHLENKVYQKPKFSVILPTLNRGFCINNAIDSILQQTYQNFELIIIDDGSTDDTKKQIIKQYKTEIANGKIIFYRFEENQGVSKARNKGLELATNPWIAYIDSDNIVIPSFLETFANQIITNRAKTYYAQLMNKNQNTIIGDKFDTKSLFDSKYIDMGSFVHSKDLVKEFGGFDENMTRLVDWELIIRYTNNYKPVFIPKIVLYYNDSDEYEKIANSIDLLKNKAYVEDKYLSNKSVKSVYISLSFLLLVILLAIFIIKKGRANERK